MLKVATLAMAFLLCIGLVSAAAAGPAKISEKEQYSTSNIAPENDVDWKDKPDDNPNDYVETYRSSGGEDTYALCTESLEYLGGAIKSTWVCTEPKTFWELHSFLRG